MPSTSTETAIATATMAIPTPHWRRPAGRERRGSDPLRLGDRDRLIRIRKDIRHTHQFGPTRPVRRSRSRRILRPAPYARRLSCTLTGLDTLTVGRTIADDRGGAAPWPKFAPRAGGSAERQSRSMGHIAREEPMSFRSRSSGVLDARCETPPCRPRLCSASPGPVQRTIIDGHSAGIDAAAT